MPTKPTIEELIELARQHSLTHPMTEKELREHAISFAYGNCKLDGCKVTREMVEKEARKLYGD
jgi:hypothetical protein